MKIRLEGLVKALKDDGLKFTGTVWYSNCLLHVLLLCFSCYEPKGFSCFLNCHPTRDNFWFVLYSFIFTTGEKVLTSTIESLLASPTQFCFF